MSIIQSDKCYFDINSFKKILRDYEFVLLMMKKYRLSRIMKRVLGLSYIFTTHFVDKNVANVTGPKSLDRILRITDRYINF